MLRSMAEQGSRLPLSRGSTEAIYRLPFFFALLFALVQARSILKISQKRRIMHPNG
jgi:hypothetical protein